MIQSHCVTPSIRLLGPWQFVATATVTYEGEKSIPSDSSSRQATSQKRHRKERRALNRKQPNFNLQLCSDAPNHSPRERYRHSRKFRGDHSTPRRRWTSFHADRSPWKDAKVYQVRSSISWGRQTVSFGNPDPSGKNSLGYLGKWETSTGSTYSSSPHHWSRSTSKATEENER